jgi:hypothetical protein
VEHSKEKTSKPQWDSNLQSQQANGCRRMPWTTQPPETEDVVKEKKPVSLITTFIFILMKITVIAYKGIFFKDFHSMLISNIPVYSI